MNIPRLQAKCGQAEEGEHIGKWFCDIFISFFGQKTDDQPFCQLGPFESENIAKTKMKEACKLICEQLEKEMTGEISGKYIDIKTNETRSWDEN